jgi:hypothetical protein
VRTLVACPCHRVYVALLQEVPMIFYLENLEFSLFLPLSITILPVALKSFVQSKSLAIAVM